MTPKKAVAFTVGACVLAAVLFVRPLRVIETIFYDLQFSRRPTVSQDSVVIVGIDPASISQNGAWPWPRSLIARCIETINECNPAVLAIDILFPPRPGDPAGNAALSAALCKTKNLVLPFRASSLQNGNGPHLLSMPPSVFSQRFLMLSNPEKLDRLGFFCADRFDASDTMFSSCAGRGGVINVTTSASSQKLRQVVQVIKAGDDYYPSFSLSAASAFLGCKPDEFVLDGAGQLRLKNIAVPLSSYAGTTPLHFRGSAGSIKTVSAEALLGGAVAPSLLRDKLVFFGVTDAGTGADFFTTPVGSQFPGVELWATAALDILQKSWIRENIPVFDACNTLLAFFLFPGLFVLIPGRKKALILSAATILALLSLGSGAFLFRTAFYFWNPVNHLVAWLFCVVMLAAQKNMPFLAEYPPIDFSPPSATEKDATPPPREEDYSRKLPDAESAFFVAQKLNISPGRPSMARQEETFSGTITEDNVYAAPTVAPQKTERPDANAVLTPEQRARFQDLCNGRIVRLLGSGGMADVYLVWNPRLEVYRAVKVLKPGQPSSFLSRFETEIRILSKLQHPNIVQFYSVGEWHGLPYIEMEYVPGAAMDDVYAKCALLSPQEAMAVGVLTCRALHYAHTRPTTIYGAAYKGVIHRDLKPGNIMLSKSGMVKLADFGIARPSEVSLHTIDAGKVVGTLPYLAPEQFDGGAISGQVDIYALGATLYEFLTGERAYPQLDVTALLMAKTKMDVKPLPGHVPKNLTGIITKAMANATGERYATAQSMGYDLENALRSTPAAAGYGILEGLVKRFNQ